MVTDPATLHRTQASTVDDGEEAVTSFARERIEDAGGLRLHELFTSAEQLDPIYWLPDRNGICVLAVRTRALTNDQLVTLLKYRLAQYLAVGMLDPRPIAAAGLTHEPTSSVAADDLHVIAGFTDSGEILCYMTIRTLDDVPSRVTLRTRERALYPVEQVFGWGIYNRLRMLPDLPINKVREVGRFVKNQRLPEIDEASVRAPVETSAALFRMLVGPLRNEVEAIVGDLEEGIVTRCLDFFHAPTVILHGMLPYSNAEAYLYRRYAERTCYPFALLSADVLEAVPRLLSVEEALAQPGKRGLLALLALKQDTTSLRSSLVPVDGLVPLTEAKVQQQGVDMETRRQMLDVGHWLTGTRALGSLSPGEATILSTFMERGQVNTGDLIIRQGDTDDDLYIIESGEAAVEFRNHAGERLRLGTRRAGDTVGEIALVTGGSRTADVVALAPMSVLKLSSANYARYLGHMVEVERDLAETAAVRALETAQKLASATD
jgi:hypothetical protein